MIIHSINDLSNKTIISLLEKELETVKNNQIIKNYHPDYKDTPGNLFYNLNHGRYDVLNGNFFVIEEDQAMIACAGWNRYELNPEVALLLTRAYVNPKIRTQYFLGNHLLERCLKEAERFPKKWMTFNEYNLSGYKWFLRASENKRTVLFNDWPDIYRNFKPIGEREVYYTKQYVVEHSDEEHI